MLVPPIDISLKPGEDAADWATQLNASVLPTGSLRRPSDGAVTELPGFDDGKWWIQDAAAAMPVTLAGDIAGKSVIDLCAAPGGKTVQLAAAGGKVTAVDRSAQRMQRVADNLKRTQLEADMVVADAGTWQPETLADLVLLDAPCSATGTIRRHPDLPHLKSPDGIAGMQPLQAALLTNAANMVALGGMLIYCVCSLQRPEGEDQIDAFLKTHSGFERQPITASELPDLATAITCDGDARILPCFWHSLGGLDGFFIARLKRLS